MEPELSHQLKRRDAFHVLGMEGRFTPATTKDIAALWGRFAPQMHHIEGQVGTVCYGIMRVADEAPQGEFLYAACVEVASLGNVLSGWVGFTVPANLYAVFTHRGHIHLIGETMQRIWGRELEQAGLEPLRAPSFELYDERWDPRTGMGDVDIFIPVPTPA